MNPEEPSMKHLSRRGFVSLAAASRRRKVFICLIDGLGPEYIRASDMPNLKRFASAGTYREGKGMMPSLTNVNSASLATGDYPEHHGITANTFFDPALRREVEMSAPGYLLRPTVFEYASRRGWKTAFVGAKAKIQSLVASRATISLSAEASGVPMYEAENSYWVFEQGRKALRDPDVRMLYLTTTDFMMHTYAPGHERSREHLHEVDRALGSIVDDHPNLELYLCADHGMNAKTVAIDPVRLLYEKGLRARGAAAIADKHKVHHRDLGGSLYLDLEEHSSILKARDVLRAEEGVEEVLLREEAAKRFRLRADRTGDLFVLAGKNYALGSMPKTRTDVKVRTHGSLHETTVPLLVYGRKPKKLDSIVDLTAGRAWEESS
jgi:phosphonoacetate hydrolase